MTVHFDDALSRTIEVAGTLKAPSNAVFVVRDVLGRSRIIISGAERPSDELQAAALDALTDLEAFAPGPDPILWADELLSPDSILTDPTARVVETGPGQTAEVTVLERTLVGSDWQVVTEPTETDGSTVVALYSLKGGVGRSTAAAFLADNLASTGSTVLLIDLDLESPGIGPLLLDPEALPDFGVVDILVEGAVGIDAAHEAIVQLPRVFERGTGEIWLAPASGRARDGYTFLPKLSRAYLDAPSLDPEGDVHPFAERLQDAITALVAAVEARSSRPNIVLLDCRAGVQDVAAVAITHLANHALLFAADTDQTWWGYAQLFQQWAERPHEAKAIRERLKLVASMVDRGEPDEYLSRFRENAAGLFETLYDRADADDPDAFNPPIDDEAAPHSPLPIFFDAELHHARRETFGAALENELIRASFGPFFEGITHLLETGTA